MNLFIVFILVCGVAQAEVAPSKNAKLRGIEWTTTPALRKRFNSYFEDLMNKPWDVLNFKIKIDQISKELFNSGYFSSAIKTELGGDENNIVVKVTLNADQRTNFQFRGNKVFSHQELRQKLIDKIKNDFGKMDRNALETFLIETYESVGVYNTTVRSYQNEGKDLEGIALKNYFFVINEGEKLKVNSVIYRGNVVFTSTDLDQVFKKNATVLAQSGHYDRTFFENYTNIVKKEYLSKGFIFADVSKPRIVTNEEDDSLSIEYTIAEKQQVILKAINLNRIDESMQEKVKQLLTNKEGSPLNVVELENDLKKTILYFQEQGYYFTTIANLNGESLLVYDKSYTTVELRPDIVLDRKICYNEAVVNGNSETRSQVIYREIDLNKGDLITPKRLDNIRQKLSGLGLFSSLRISPYMIYEGDENSCAKTNLVIQVKEKDFGLWEIAPGYRTDLGAKISAGITYNNFMGMNRSFSGKLQFNHRTNLDGFDARRREDHKDLWEYLGKITYVEPYLFHNFINQQIEFESSASFQRKRFTSFDADILRVSPQIAKTISLSPTRRDNLALAISYQYEKINQFDATAAKDNDNFKIGGITPSITLDLRNDAISPRKGAYFNLSSEWANNYFGSMKNDDLEINYVKVISRNRFYYPVGDFTLAFSLALGYEKNFAQDILKDSNGNVQLNENHVAKTHGYIPSIKVFRLDGYDEIRGYDSGEINRLINGTSINEVVVQNEAYFTAFKFEPRYNVSDTLQLDIFYDAGRVTVNEFKPFKLRSSVGAGFKVLTPVGSLDFDYGVKLQRNIYAGNVRESFGRFHLSIGYF